MPSRPTTAEQKADARRLKSLFLQWQEQQREAGADVSQQEAAMRLGMSQSALTQRLNGTLAINVSFAAAIARMLNIRVEQFSPGLAAEIGSLSGTPPSEKEKGNEKSISETIPMSSRMLPVLTYVQAGHPMNDCVDDYAPGAADEYVPVDSLIARRLGQHAFALRVEGDSMEPVFFEGDLVVVNPGASISTGDYVVAALHDKSRATLKKYVDRGVDATGCEQFDLVPLNTTGHITIRINSTNPGSIVGRVMQKITTF